LHDLDPTDSIQNLLTNARKHLPDHFKENVDLQKVPLWPALYESPTTVPKHTEIEKFQEKEEEELKKNKKQREAFHKKLLNHLLLLYQFQLKSIFLEMKKQKNYSQN